MFLTFLAPAHLRPYTLSEYRQKLRLDALSIFRRGRRMQGRLEEWGLPDAQKLWRAVQGLPAIFTK